MPDSSFGRRTAAAGSQSLKSPITETRSASGAHTAKYAPSRPLTLMRWAPSFSYRWVWVPSLNR